MAQRLVVCTHCEGKKLCRADRGRSCEVCKTAAGVPRRGGTGLVRCSFCSGHGRVRVEVAEAEEPTAEKEEEAAAEPEPEA